MIRKPKPATTLLLAMISTGVAMLAGLSAAAGDESNDRRANQPLINPRNDRLSEPGSPQSDSPPTLDSPTRNGTTGAGSFPRSFLIPGTDTAVRVGGSVGASMGFR